MEISPRLLAIMLLWSGILGLALGVLYDVIRIIRIMTLTDTVAHTQAKQEKEWIRSLYRRKIPLPLPLSIYGKTVMPVGNRSAPKKRTPIAKALAHVALFISDIAFFAISGAAISLVLYYTNDGELRLLAPTCTAISFIAYQLTVAKAVRSVAHIASFVLRSAITYLVLSALLPLVLVGKLFMFIARATVKRLVKYIAEKRDAVESKKKYLSIVAAAEHGMLECGACKVKEKKNVKGYNQQKGHDYAGRYASHYRVRAGARVRHQVDSRYDGNGQNKRGKIPS